MTRQITPTTYRAVTPEGIFHLDSTRPLTHAVIATRSAFGPEYSANGYVNVEQAERAAQSRRTNDHWTKVEVVEVIVPATTNGRPAMTAAEYHAA